VVFSTVGGTVFFDIIRGFNVDGFGVAVSGFLRNLDRFLLF